MVVLRDSDSLESYADFYLSYLHYLSSFLTSFLESASYDSIARIFSLDFSKSIDCKFYNSAMCWSFCCIYAFKAYTIVLYFSYKIDTVSLFALLISPKDPFNDCFAFTCELLLLLLDSVTNEEFYLTANEFSLIPDSLYFLDSFCCFYFCFSFSFYLSFSLWATNLCNCWLMLSIYCLMRLF